MKLTLADIVSAKHRIADGIYLSPCPESIPLGEICGAHIYCKLDYLQRTGSFKERGARNALLLLDDQQRLRGVISASAGNHARHRRHAQICSADQVDHLPPAGRRGDLARRNIQ